MTQHQLLWELLEMEAPVKFYIDNAEKPAFLLFPKYHWAASKSRVFLYMNGVTKIGEFRSEKKALEFLKDKIENHATRHIKVYMVQKYGRKRGKRIFFAESKVKELLGDEEAMKKKGMEKG